MGQTTIIDGRFELIAQIGAGGMGTIWRAIDRHDGGTIAVKLLEREGTAAIDRFERESRILQSTRHTAIVRYIAHGRTDDGTRWLAMEWVEGEDLATRLRAGPLGVREALELGARVAD